MSHNMFRRIKRFNGALGSITMRLEWDVKKKPIHESDNEEIVANGGICDTHPHFATNSSGEAEAVILDKSAYVKLLIDARIGDEDCWPPGLEKGAVILQRLIEIEEMGVAKHGVFMPEKLSRKLQNEYMKLNLALDELQNELQDELELEAANLPEDTTDAETKETPFIPPSSFTKFASQLAARQHEYKTWEEYPTIHNNEHFA